VLPASITEPAVVPEITARIIGARIVIVTSCVVPSTVATVKVSVSVRRR
jgi:hypothetical protein